ncbi:MAG: LamG-like jellyroll fold domain-containing protein [Candidatus Micrarchaeaceae archaeon]
MEINKNMKGFIFTLDAVFALVVAAVGISILLYINFTSATSYSAPVAQAYATMQSMLHTTLQEASGVSPYAGYLATSANYAGSATWQQFGNGSGIGSSAPYSPQGAFLLYSSNNLIGEAIQGVAVNSGYAAVAAGNSVYVLNPMTGAEYGRFYSSAATSNVVSPPAIYKGMLYYADSNDVVSGADLYNMSVQWRFSSQGPITTPIGIDDNYVTFGTSSGFYLLNALNGTEAAFGATYLPTRQPMYVDGEYVVSTDSQGQNYLYSYSLGNGKLSMVWNAMLSSGLTTAPSSVNGTIAVGSGNYIYIFGLGGTEDYQSSNMGTSILGIGGYGNYYYVQSSLELYTVAPGSGRIIFTDSNPYDVQNTTPSAGPGAVYTLIDGNYFTAYNTSTGSMIWNITLPDGRMNISYSGIALAYGNMYVANGNALYAFGTYKPNIGDGVLLSIAEMYMNGQGSYSDALMDSIYNTSNMGIFINNTYAPDMSAASFNSLNSSDILQSTGFKWMNNAAQPFSVSVWVYPTSSNGVIVSQDEQYSPSTGTNKAIIGLVNGNATMALNGFTGCSGLGSIQLHKWSNIVVTFNGTNETGYINGIMKASVAGTEGSFSAGTAIYYPLGSSDSNNCGSGAYYNGSMLDYQIYNISLDPQQVASVWQGGAFAAPISMQHSMLWWPLNGNANDFSGFFDIGIQHKINYNRTSFMPMDLTNAYEVSRSSVPMLLNVNGVNREYNVSVVTWR